MSGSSTASLPAPAGEVTQLLGALRRGDAVDSAALLQEVYAELHRLARMQRARWRGDETLNTTALVHEAYLKLVGTGGDFESRAHFLAVAATAMRRLLVTYAEGRRAAKRGGGLPDLSLNEHGGDIAFPLSGADVDDLADLDEALQRYARMDARGARVVECRFFGGMSAEETATALGISTATVTRAWRVARAWLFEELRRDPLPRHPA